MQKVIISSTESIIFCTKFIVFSTKLHLQHTLRDWHEVPYGDHLLPSHRSNLSEKFREFNVAELRENCGELRGIAHQQAAFSSWLCAVRNAS